MNDSTCATAKCDRRAHARGLCKTCYGRLWRSGQLQPELPFDIHSLTRVDVETSMATCAICGPVKIRIRAGRRGHECMTVRAERRRGQRSTPGLKGVVTPEDRRRWKYKITGEEYSAMVDRQGGRCAICQAVADLSVDHDHSCCPGTSTCGGCIRGLLCTFCNRGLGSFRDDHAALLRAAEYLADGGLPK